MKTSTWRSDIDQHIGGDAKGLGDVIEEPAAGAAAGRSNDSGEHRGIKRAAKTSKFHRAVSMQFSSEILLRKKTLTTKIHHNVGLTLKI